MRILLRLVAAYTLVSVIGTVFLIGGMWHRGVLPLLPQSGAAGVLTFAGWFFTFVAGVPAVIFLWKLTDPGRIAAAITWSSMGLYYLLLIAKSHTLGPNSVQVLFQIIGSIALVALVLSPAARRACQQKALPAE